MQVPGRLQHLPAAGGATGGAMRNEQQKGEMGRPVGLDNSSGADLDVVNAYLQQLLPALATAGTDGTDDSLGGLGLDRQSLLAAGLPQHSINSLYRSLAAHAGAFKKLMSSEVQQLRQLLQAPQLSNTLQILDGPVTAQKATQPAAQRAIKAGRVQSMPQSMQDQLLQQQQLLTAAAADAIPAASKASEHVLGPTADELVKDYAEAYASMKESMEVRLRHEQRRSDFLAGKLQQAEAAFRDTTAQFEAANRRISEQTAEAGQLHEQVAQLQADLAASHAAHLALQQHHKDTLETANKERQEIEELHRKTVEALQQDLTAAGGAAAALAESSRQVEALRLLYNEELSRASRLAVELSRATEIADKAAAAEDAWRRQLKKSDSRADNAEGMAHAMKATVQQLEDELTQERAKLEAETNHASQLRLMLERSRMAAMEQRAHAHVVVTTLANKCDTAHTQLSEVQNTLSRTEDTLKLRLMELEGANSQLQAGRSHMKQLLSDLETEQEKTTNLASDLQKLRAEMDEAQSQRDVAEGRVKTLQGQLSKANDSNAAMHQKLMDVQSTMEERSAELAQLQEAHEAEQAAHTALRSQAADMKARLAELSSMEQQLEHLKEEHATVVLKLELAERENGELSIKARQLLFTTEELEQLRHDHTALQARTDSLSHQLSATTHSLNEAQTAQQETAAELVDVTDKLEKAEQDRANLMRQLFDATSAGDTATQQAAEISNQLESVQQALEAAEADRQALVAQRDGWMASFQEAYGKLQEWTVASEAASRRLAIRASAIQSAMQQLTNNLAEGNAAADAAAGSGDGSTARATAGENAAAAVTASVLDQMSGLQQLMQAESHKHQEVYDGTLKKLQDAVQQRHQAAQNSWSEAMEASNKRRASRAASRASKLQQRNSLAAAYQQALTAAGATDAETADACADHAGFSSINGKRSAEQESSCRAGAAAETGRVVQPQQRTLQMQHAVEHAGTSGDVEAVHASVGATAQPDADLVQQQTHPSAIAVHSESDTEVSLLTQTSVNAAEVPSASGGVNIVTSQPVGAADVPIEPSLQPTAHQGMTVDVAAASAATPGPAAAAAAVAVADNIACGGSMTQQHAAANVADVQQAPAAQIATTRAVTSSQNMIPPTSYMSVQAGQQQWQESMPVPCPQQQPRQSGASQAQPAVQPAAEPAAHSRASVASSQAQVHRLPAQQPQQTQQNPQQEQVQQPAAQPAAHSNVSVGSLEAQLHRLPAQQLQQTQQNPPQQQVQQHAYQQLLQQHQLLQRQHQMLLQHLYQQQRQGPALAAIAQSNQSRAATVAPQISQHLQQESGQLQLQQQESRQLQQQESEQQQQQQQAVLLSAESMQQQQPIAAQQGLAGQQTQQHQLSQLEQQSSCHQQQKQQPSGSTAAQTAVLAAYADLRAGVQEAAAQDSVLCPAVSSAVPLRQTSTHQQQVTSTTTTVTTVTTTSSISSAGGVDDAGSAAAHVLMESTISRRSNSSSHQAVQLMDSAGGETTGSAVLMQQSSSNHQHVQSHSETGWMAAAAADLGNGGFASVVQPEGRLTFSNDFAPGVCAGSVPTSTSRAVVPSFNAAKDAGFNDGDVTAQALNAACEPAPSIWQLPSLDEQVSAATTGSVALYDDRLGQCDTAAALWAVPREGAATPDASAAVSFNFLATAQGVAAGNSFAFSLPPGQTAGPPAVMSADVSRLGSPASPDSPSSPACGRGAAKGRLSELVSLATYQEQMKSVAALHSQVGELVVRLREAHADADGAQQQLQQERQEAVQRTAALRGALNQLHTQLEELRTDHQTLQDAHRALVAKDLMKSGVLKDRYVADLFSRLQEAEWRLSIARQRACTWGFEMMVPLGRVDRGIQTQYAEVWAASQQQLVSGTAGKVPVQGISESSSLPDVQSYRPLSGGTSRRRLDPLPLSDPGAGMSASTGAVRLLGSPTTAAVERKQPAFAQHGSSGNAKDQTASSKTSSQPRPLSAESAAQARSGIFDASLSPGLSSAVLYAAAEELLAAGDVQLLSVPALLQVIASLYSAKAAADATALRSHRPAQGLWGFLVKRLNWQQTGRVVPDAGSTSKKTSKSEKAQKSSSSGSTKGSDWAATAASAAAALAQLLGSVQQHACSSREIAQFSAALSASRTEYHQLVDKVEAAAPEARQGSASSAHRGPSTASSNSCEPADSSGNTVFKGSWGEVQLDSGKLLPVVANPEQVLLQAGVAAMLECMLRWPGMMPLLRWVAGGHFLVGLQDGDLGQVLMDVQAPHVHFALLEAADILGLHPLPQLHVVQEASPFVHMLCVPKAKPAAASQQQHTEVSSRQSHVLLVISSAAMQLLQPGELQAAMAGALVPALLAGCQDAESVGCTHSEAHSTSTSGAAAANAAAMLGLSSSNRPGLPHLADLATLSALLALQPSYLLSHLPPEMHAMGSSLAAALQAAQRLTAVAGDRGSLLVAQHLDTALSVILRTSKGTQLQGLTSNAEDTSSGSVHAAGREMMVQQWLQQVEDQPSLIPTIQQLLPSHKSLASSAGIAGSECSRFGVISRTDSCSSGNVEITDQQVLMMRLHDLADWARSEQYQQIMAAARPLRRVLQRNRVASA